MSTGLVFAGTSPGFSAACGPETGCTFSNQTGTAGFSTLTFDFTSFGFGDSFEVDIDTDGGPGIDASSVGSSLVVTIRLTDGTVFTGTPTTVNAELAQITF